jgi:hypothetical protein
MEHTRFFMKDRYSYSTNQVTSTGIPPEQNSNRVLNDIHRILIEL